MQPNQKLVGANGYEVFLFPVPALYITQAIGGDFSHKGTYAMDCVGWNGGQIYKAPYYAPFSCTKIWELVGSGGSVWQSDTPVNTPLGVDYCRILFYHDDAPPAMWSHRNQGDLIGHSGTTGYVTGDHIHMECAIGALSGNQLRRNEFGNGMLIGSNMPYLLLYINGTNIVQGYGYPWLTAQTLPPPPSITVFTVESFNEWKKGTVRLHGTASSSGSGEVKYSSLRIKQNGVEIALKYWDNGTQNIDRYFDYDIQQVGDFTAHFEIADNYGQAGTPRVINFTIIKSNDIMMLYLMNIIDGDYNPIKR